MSAVDMQSVLGQLRQLRATAEGMGAHPTQSVLPSTVSGATGASPDFGMMVTNAISKVNASQQQAASVAQAFEIGTNGVDLAQVMIATQKASLSFEAMTQVRNKLVQAYQEIMNMPM